MANVIACMNLHMNITAFQLHILHDTQKGERGREVNVLISRIDRKGSNAHTLHTVSIIHVFQRFTIWEIKIECVKSIFRKHSFNLQLSTFIGNVHAY